MVVALRPGFRFRTDRPVQPVAPAVLLGKLFVQTLGEVHRFVPADRVGTSTRKKMDFNEFTSTIDSYYPIGIGSLVFTYWR